MKTDSKDSALKSGKLVVVITDTNVKMLVKKVIVKKVSVGKEYRYYEGLEGKFQHENVREFHAFDTPKEALEFLRK